MRALEFCNRLNALREQSWLELLSQSPVRTLPRYPPLILRTCGASNFSEPNHMSKPIVRARTLAAERQNHRCYYCGVLMLQGEVMAFLTKHCVSKRQAKLLQCTAEHMTPKSQGGTNSHSNIVAACFFCNHARHARSQPLDTLAYKRFVQHRVARGRWLVASLPSSLRSQA